MIIDRYSNPLYRKPAAYYYNMCGPGSSETVVSGWNSKPGTYSGTYWTGYIQSQGLRWLGYMFYLADTEEVPSQNYNTPNTNEINTINSEIGTPYYVEDDCAGAKGGSCDAYSRWQSDVDYDIQSASRPLVAEVYTCNTSGQACMPGWPYRADHFEATIGYNPGSQLDTYFETGSSADTCYFNYTSPAPDAYSGTWTDPQNGQQFSEGSGIDTTSSQYLWNRTYSLIW